MNDHPSTDLDELAGTAQVRGFGKTDLAARVRSTALDGIEAARDVATTAAHQAAAVAGAAAGRVQAGMESLRTSIGHADGQWVRRPLPLGALLAAAAAVGVVIYVVARGRR